MAGTTINPYRFGGQLGYRTDSSSRLYVQQRHVDTPKGRWISRDPVSLVEADFNFYWYTKNNPATYRDPSGRMTIPDCNSAKGLRKIPCPPSVAIAKKAICAALTKYSPSTLSSSSKCLTGPTQAGCLIDWCRNNSNIYCISSSDTRCTGACAFSCSVPGTQNPGWAIFICYPNVTGGICEGQSGCLGQLSEPILHEIIGVCGSHHTWGTPPYKDQCSNKAVCMCRFLGL